MRTTVCPCSWFLCRPKQQTTATLRPLFEVRSLGNPGHKDAAGQSGHSNASPQSGIVEHDSHNQSREGATPRGLLWQPRPGDIITKRVSLQWGRVVCKAVPLSLTWPFHSPSPCSPTLAAPVQTKQAPGSSVDCQRLTPKQFCSRLRNSSNTRLKTSLGN
ncbi:hypothetical protein DPEC_G00264650 [Dallia pectoralis]|uniref:Uncharacterized protein n=1 Tax=Dallia pectoralis TaxID=75939 RepID=A0ACC2FSW1_DALPE|nr:hypothetical protein DPEC_G00264650 [Dallia pectoralis]